MLEPRQMNEDGLDVRVLKRRMMNMLAILLALVPRNFSKFSDQRMRGAVLLGHVRHGQWLGEMGVIENLNGSATARANEEGEVLRAQNVLERVSSDPGLARELILRLSIKLRGIEDKIAGELLGASHERAPDQAASESGSANNIGISLTAESIPSRADIGAAPIQVTKLPFLTGRVPAEGEATPSPCPDLLVKDDIPFHLSRQHFMIARRGTGFVVSDVKSTLGTIVNGQAIGHHFAKDSAPLHRGENHILAGGWDSPFKFLVTIN
jgi:CRP/FNR family transcriptional regulator, cyclic AMP receptor protein